MVEFRYFPLRLTNNFFPQNRVKNEERKCASAHGQKCPSAHMGRFVCGFFFFALFKCIILLMVYLYVSTNFDLEPKTGLGFDPTSPNNKFVEHGRKN